MFKKYTQQLKKNLSDKAFWLSNAKTLGVMFIIIFAVSAYQQRSMITGTAPALQGTLLNGESFRLADQEKKPTLVYFWATWCGVCKTTSPFVSRLTLENADIKNRDYNIVSIALSSGSNTDISDYLTKNNYTLNVLNDAEGGISKTWGVAVTPSIFIIDATGNIRYISTGITSLWGMKLRLWLASF